MPWSWVEGGADAELSASGSTCGAGVGAGPAAVAASGLEVVAGRCCCLAAVVPVPRDKWCAAPVPPRADTPSRGPRPERATNIAMAPTFMLGAASPPLLHLALCALLLLLATGN